jgi:hypothetical protein
MATNRRLRRGAFLTESEASRDEVRTYQDALRARERRQAVARTPVNPGTAVLLSLFIPGSGLIYAGRIGQGVLMLVGIPLLTMALYVALEAGLGPPGAIFAFLIAGLAQVGQVYLAYGAAVETRA